MINSPWLATFPLHLDFLLRDYTSSSPINRHTWKDTVKWLWYHAGPFSSRRMLIPWISETLNCILADEFGVEEFESHWPSNPIKHVWDGLVVDPNLTNALLWMSGAHFHRRVTPYSFSVSDSVLLMTKTNKIVHMTSHRFRTLSWASLPCWTRRSFLKTYV